MVTLIGCSGIQTKTKKVYPDDLWLQHTKSGITKVMVETYGAVKDKALPQCKSALKLCNVDKASIRNWKEEGVSTD